MKTVLLSSGHPMPVHAFGSGTKWYGNHTFGIKDAVKAALKAGFTHIDCAESYGTEREVGEGIHEFLAESGAQRSSIFVTNKVSAGFDNVKQTCTDSLEKLGLTYFDLYLVHHPFFASPPKSQVWAEMEGLVKAGLARSIGVSNFSVSDLKELLPLALIKPAVNQIEFHPYLQQPSLTAFCAANGIQVEAYAPLASIAYAPGGPVDPVVNELASKHSKTPAQVLIRWSVQRGNAVINTSGKRERIGEFLDADSFTLSEDEVKRTDEAGSKKFFRQWWVEQYAAEDAKHRQ